MFSAFQALRRDEEAARVQLEAGCRADLERIGRLIEPPLRKARSELEAYLSSLGSLEPILVANLKREHAQFVALRCASGAFANASVRFRARFGMYADALVAAQKQFVETVMSNVGVKGRYPGPPRRMAMPRIDLDEELAIFPQSELSLAELDGWIGDLGKRLQTALKSTVSMACLKVLNRGARDLARTSVAVRLASLSVPDHTLGAPTSIAPKTRS
jgi:hypothetical protein